MAELRLADIIAHSREWFDLKHVGYVGSDNKGCIVLNDRAITGIPSEHRMELYRKLSKASAEAKAMRYGTHILYLLHPNHEIDDCDYGFETEYYHISCV